MTRANYRSYWKDGDHEESGMTYKHVTEGEAYEMALAAYGEPVRVAVIPGTERPDTTRHDAPPVRQDCAGSTITPPADNQDRVELKGGEKCLPNGVTLEKHALGHAIQYVLRAKRASDDAFDAILKEMIELDKRTV